jgi:hypothetical protein
MKAKNALRHKGLHVPEWTEEVQAAMYHVWGRIMSLPSYGLIAGQKDNPMLSRKDVIEALEGPRPKQPELGDDFC